MAVVTVSSDPSNAALERKAGSLGWCNRLLVGASPLEGLVIRSSTPRYFSGVLPELVNSDSFPAPPQSSLTSHVVQAESED